MLKLFKKVSKTAGLLPGAIVHVGERKTERIRISVFDYGKKQFSEKEIRAIEDCFDLKKTSTVSWINIDGLHDTEGIRKIGAHFELHPLILEDIVNTSQRPKIEDFKDHLFIVLKMISWNETADEINIEQVSMVVGKNYVISFQEVEGDVFNQIRDRLRNGKGKIRTQKSDYLAYALIDAVIDNYFVILEKIGDSIESIEGELVENPSPSTMHAIHGIKREMLLLRKNVWPLREVINGMQRRESSLIQKSTLIYLRDIYDHTMQVIDTLETFRDVVSGLLDIYLSSISNKMNEVMKVLTLIATIFIPLTFIAGIYGMNFKYMPELSWKYGYAFIWGIILLAGITMGLYFKRKKWL
ncbi:MAG: magnesium/cobalt transporter CorA [bacterium]